MSEVRSVTWRHDGVAAHDDSNRARTFRTQLGLPTDEPVILTGHQAGIWHAGVLAKYLAIRRYLGRRVHLVVDIDVNDGEGIAYPGFDGTRRTWRTGPVSSMPTGWRPPVQKASAPADGLTGDVDAGLARIADALRRFEGEPSMAVQFTKASWSLATDALGATNDAIVLEASKIAATDLFAEIVERMRRDPDQCIEAYNDAVASHPEAGVRPMQEDELPLWTIDENGRRPFDGTSPHPRAILMSGLVRLAGCEAFIHGLGGERYEQVTSTWLERWLDESLHATAPIVTADVVIGNEADDADVERAVWRAHHARHDPAMLGDDDGAARKRALVERIRESSGDRAALFRDLQVLLQLARASHRDAIERFEAEASSAKRRRRERLLRLDRTWPFPLHETGAVRALDAALDTIRG